MMCHQRLRKHGELSVCFCFGWCDLVHDPFQHLGATYETNWHSNNSLLQPWTKAHGLDQRRLMLEDLPNLKSLSLWSVCSWVIRAAT